LTTPFDLSSVKLSDFGVVRILEDASKNGKERPQILSQVGSVAYMGMRSRNHGRKPAPLAVGLTRRPGADCLAASGRAAPEIFLGKPYDESVDMWACGVLLYMLYVRWPCW